MIRIVSVADDLPDGFETLRTAARAQGYKHIDRLAEDWASGACKFTHDGEALFAAYVGDTLAGIGGVTREPSDPEGAVMRARRTYVLPDFRSQGVGRALAGAIVQQGLQRAPRVTVNAHPDSHAFWERMGFARIDAPGLTHAYSA